MKKFLSILLVIAMVASLVAMLIVPTSASTPSSTRKVTADDAYVTVSHEGGGAANKDALIDGVIPESESIYTVGGVSWFPAASGDYATIHLNDQISISELKLYGTGNYSKITVQIFDTAGTKTFEKDLWLQGAGTIETHAIIEANTSIYEARTIKIIGSSLKWDDGRTDKVSELEITGHFHDFGDPTAEVAPSCGIDGSATYSCSECSVTKIEKIEKTNAHIWSTTATETLTPAADREGILQYKCTVNNCPAYKEEKLPCLGHNTTCTRVEADCENDGSVTYVCNDDGCDYELSYVLDKLNHIPSTTSTVHQKATIWCNEILAYECTRPECDGAKLVETPNSMLENPDDAVIRLGNDNIDSITEDDTNANGTVSANRNKDCLFDRIIETSYWKPTNFWSGVAGSKLIIEFDKEYLFLDAKIHVSDNYNDIKIQFFNAEDEAVGLEFNAPINNGQNFDSVDLTGNTKNQFIKKIVITVVNAKNPTATQFTEFVINAHGCKYEQADRENINTVPAECKTTFDGLCRLCDIHATGVVEYNHTFEKETGTELDKIYSDRENDIPVTCYQDGIGYKHCTVCQADVDTYTPATGVHDFENGEPVYDKDSAPDCGNPGTGHKKCATPGCTAVSEDCDFPATGAHSKWNWKVIEGEEPDYTHTGLKGYFCGVCGYQDTSKENQVADMTKLNAVSTKDWSVRYTDFVSPRATFKLSKKNIEAIEDEFDVKIFGVVQKGEATKEIQVYGEGATGKVGSDGTFSLVVKGASYTDEYKFSVRVEITCKADNTKAENTVTSKNITTAPDGTVSAKDVATYLIAPNRVDELDAELKKFFEKIAE
ncbi:MAG: hypothetical protein E7622_06680 [Ruminococcaceae bacterium]|nr:hypothetical protein [Oscillospiraceae bacterium]